MSEFLRLLDRQVEQNKELVASLERQLFGERKEETVTTQDIKNAMDLAASADKSVAGFLVHPDTYRNLAKEITGVASKVVPDNSGARINLTCNGKPVYQSSNVMPGSVYSTSRLQVVPSGWEQTNPYKKGAYVTASDEILKDNYMDELKKNVFDESPIMKALKKEKEKVSIVKDLRAEINHDKEVKRVTKALKKFEGSWLYKLEAGARIGFETDFGNDEGTVYTYAAVFDGKRWHLTGAKSPNGIVTDDLVDWMIEAHVEFKDVKLLVAKKQ